jgi:hypothetical protein
MEASRKTPGYSSTQQITSKLSTPPQFKISLKAQANYKVYRKQFPPPNTLFAMKN